MVDMTKTTTTEKKLTPSDIRGVFIRSNLFQGSWNFERMQALGFCFSIRKEPVHLFSCLLLCKF